MTYSIVAHDQETGAIGVAVQSHWFGVGAVVTWGRAGVGAVATQSVAEPAYGPRLLDRLQAGETPQTALDALLAADGNAAVRQVACVGAGGDIAVHTGDGCIAYAGHVTGRGFSVQANLMASPDVWPAMAQAYERAAGPLSRRLVAALHAAEAAGGDVRGRQSAALLVVPAGGERHATLVDVRVDDHPEPLHELDRLLDLTDAYALAGEADELAGQGLHARAGDCYTRASALAPDNYELLFWAGLAAAAGGDLPTALTRVREAIAAHPGWRDLLGRLPEATAPGASAVREALEAA